MKDSLKRFIGLDTETQIQTITAVVMALIDFLSVFGFIEFTDPQMQAVHKLVLCLATAIVWGYCSHYKNNNYTPEMVVATIKGRDAKQKRLWEQETVEEPEDSYEHESEVIADEI